MQLHHPKPKHHIHNTYRGCRKAVITSLDNELKCMSMIQKIPPCPPRGMSSNRWKVLYYRKEIEGMKYEALQNFLIMHCVSKGIDVNNHHYIPDQDRVAVTQAIRCKLPLKYIKLLLKDYPKACESGGVVDHINHPIHVACQENREVVRLVLERNPECANQRDQDGKLPFELFIENEDTIDISSEEFVSTTNLFNSLSPRSREVFSRSRESLRNQIISNCILPSHIHERLNDVTFTFSISTHGDDDDESVS